MNSQEIGRKIRRARKEMGLSMKEIGDKLHLSQQAISQYELNKRDIPTDVFIAWLNILGVEIDTFIESISDISQEDKNNYLEYLEMLFLDKQENIDSIQAAKPSLSIDELKLMAKILGISVSDLIGPYDPKYFINVITSSFYFPKISKKLSTEEIYKELQKKMSEIYYERLVSSQPEIGNELKKEFKEVLKEYEAFYGEVVTALYKSLLISMHVHVDVVTED